MTWVHCVPATTASLPPFGGAGIQDSHHAALCICRGHQLCSCTATTNIDFGQHSAFTSSVFTHAFWAYLRKVHPDGVTPASMQAGVTGQLHS